MTRDGRDGLQTTDVTMTLAAPGYPGFSACLVMEVASAA